MISKGLFQIKIRLRFIDCGGVAGKILKPKSTKIKNQVRFTFLENEYAKQNSQLVASVAKQNDNTEAGFLLFASLID